MVKQAVSNGYFLESPFSNVADESSARCWSGRPKVLENLLRLRRSFARMADSTLDIVWANLGAGKTHTLLHFAYLLQEESSQTSRTICAFVEMPEQVRGFLDLYIRVVTVLPLDTVAGIVAAFPRVQ